MFSEKIQLTSEIMNILLNDNIDTNVITKIISTISEDIDKFHIDLEKITFPVNSNDSFQVEVHTIENREESAHIEIVIGVRDWSFDYNGKCIASGTIIG